MSIVEQTEVSGARHGGRTWVTRLFVCAAVALMATGGADSLRAHPVAQGSLEVLLSGNTLELRVRVSFEQIVVANTYAAAPAASLEDAFQRHGEYLLEHLYVFADDQRLSGRRAGFQAPRLGPDATHATYVFEYPLKSQPASFRLQQDVLNEFDFAPGNRWEATYVTSVRSDRAILDGALLTSHAPLVFTSDGSSNKARLARDFFSHGLHHILAGYDHLLFVSALALAVRSLWELIRVIAAFTLAHTVTLVLAVLNIARLPSHIVEPMIAASIVIVAMQNVIWPERSRGLLRLGVAFFFGLFHGLGFAGGLVEAMEGMPHLALGVAILAFSLGVELAHQAVVLPVFTFSRLIASRRENLDEKSSAGSWLLRGGSGVICAAGLFYFVSALSQ